MEQIRTKIQKRDFRGKVRHGAEWLQLWANPDDDLSALERARQRQSRNGFEQQRQSIEKLAVPLSGVEGFKHRLSEAQENWNPVEWSIARGRLARAAFDRRFHDPAAGDPSGLLARLAQARATALGLRRFPGLFEDFQRLSLRELEEAGCAHAFLAAQLPLERAILLVFVDRWSAQTQALWDSGAVDMWAAWFARKCPRSLPLLDQSLEDPQAFRAACLAFLDELAASKEFILEMDLEPGDVQFCNNYVIAHGRTDFTDSGREEEKRLMLRLWLKFRDARPVGEAFFDFGGIPVTAS